MHEQVTGANHFETGRALSNLAFVAKTLGNVVDARKLFTQALAIYEQVLGSDHHATVGIRDQIANLP